MLLAVLLLARRLLAVLLLAVLLLALLLLVLPRRRVDLRIELRRRRLRVGLSWRWRHSILFAAGAGIVAHGNPHFLRGWLPAGLYVRTLVIPYARSRLYANRYRPVNGIARDNSIRDRTGDNRFNAA